MAFCPNCGKPLTEGASFCHSCGVSLTSGTGGQSAAPEQPGAQTVSSGMTYTGPSFQQQQPDAQPLPAPEPAKKSRTGLIALLTGCGILLAAGIVLLILVLTGVIGGKEDTPDDPAATAGTTDTPSGAIASLIIGEDILPEQITNVSWVHSGGMERTEEGWRFEKSGETYRLLKTASRYDPDEDADVTDEAETVLSDAEWEELLSLLIGASYEQNPLETTDETSYYHIEWEGVHDRTSRDDLVFPDAEQQADFHAFKDALLARTESARTASLINRENVEIMPLMTGFDRYADNDYRSDIEASLEYQYDSIYWAPDVDGAGYDALHRIFEDNDWDRYRQIVDEFYDESAAAEDCNYISCQNNLSAWRLDSHVVSVLRGIMETRYWHGEYQGSMTYTAYNVNAETGEDIALSDVVTDFDTLGAYVAGRIMESEYRDDNWNVERLQIAKDNLEAEITRRLTQQDGVFFGLSYYNLVIVFDENVIYEALYPGGYGMIVPFADLPEAFDPWYTEVPAHNMSCLAQLMTDHDNIITLDGKELVLSASMHEPYADGMPSGEYTLSLNGTETTGKHESLWSFTPYLVRYYSGDYLWLLASHMRSSNNMNVIVYEIRDDALIYVGESDFCGAFLGGFWTGQIGAYETLQTIGTVGGYRYWSIDEDGIPRAMLYTDGFLPYQIVEGMPLTLKRDLTCEAYYDYGEGHTEDAGDQILTAGMVLVYYRTDGETYVDFHIGNGGMIVRLYFMFAEDGCMVNNIPAEELFENLMWAG